jgi:hypothetical protein
MLAREDQHGREQADDERARADRDERPALELALALVRLRELAVQRRVAFDLAVRFETRAR